MINLQRFRQELPDQFDNLYFPSSFGDPPVSPGLVVPGIFSPYMEHLLYFAASLVDHGDALLYAGHLAEDAVESVLMNPLPHPLFTIGTNLDLDKKTPSSTRISNRQKGNRGQSQNQNRKARTSQQSQSKWKGHSPSGAGQGEIRPRSTSGGRGHGSGHDRSHGRGRSGSQLRHFSSTPFRVLRQRPPFTSLKFGLCYYDPREDYRELFHFLQYIQPYLADQALLVIGLGNQPVVRNSLFQWLYRNPEFTLLFDLPTPIPYYSTWDDGLMLIGYAKKAEGDEVH